jgi:riboflavin synthase
MFTGLVEAMGVVADLQMFGDGQRLTLRVPGFCSQLHTGESVAVNGACMTVVVRNEESCSFELAPETLRCTNLGELTIGERVNVERALRLGDRLGGHLVQGHVDGLGRILSRQPQNEWETIWFGCAKELTRQMVRKGSVAVDGVSLTLVEVAQDRFSVALIPHTLANTTLGLKKQGNTVNLETDLLAKYAWKFLENEKLELGDIEIGEFLSGSEGKCE